MTIKELQERAEENRKSLIKDKRDSLKECIEELVGKINSYKDKHKCSVVDAVVNVLDDYLYYYDGMDEIECIAALKELHTVKHLHVTELCY